MSTELDKFKPQVPEVSEEQVERIADKVSEALSGPVEIAPEEQAKFAEKVAKETGAEHVMVLPNLGGAIQAGMQEMLERYDPAFAERLKKYRFGSIR